MILESVQSVINDNWGETGKKVVVVFQYIRPTTLAGTSGGSCLFLIKVAMAPSVSSLWRDRGDWQGFITLVPKLNGIDCLSQGHIEWQTILSLSLSHSHSRTHTQFGVASLTHMHVWTVEGSWRKPTTFLLWGNSVLHTPPLCQPNSCAQRWLCWRRQCSPAKAKAVSFLI